jgi:hypothetical protein
MQAGVSPAPDRVDGRILPRLEARAMAEVVGRLPVVEDLVAVLNGREEGCQQVWREEEQESNRQANWRVLSRSAERQERAMMANERVGRTEPASSGAA